MNLNETKKDLNPEIKKELEKSKLKVLTNENDFLVKNLKKAFLRFFTKKSFSLVRTLSLDFSNSFFISGFKSFFVSFRFIRFVLKII